MDNEPLARHLFPDYVGKVPFLALNAACASLLTALKALRTARIDLLFLDVHLPELTGLELLRSLIRPPLVVFAPAHSEYALPGYKLAAVDYLPKPIAHARFLRAAHRVYARQLDLEPSPARQPLHRCYS